MLLPIVAYSGRLLGRSMTQGVPSSPLDPLTGGPLRAPLDPPASFVIEGHSGEPVINELHRYITGFGRKEYWPPYCNDHDRANDLEHSVEGTSRHITWDAEVRCPGAARITRAARAGLCTGRCPQRHKRENGLCTRSWSACRKPALASARYYVCGMDIRGRKQLARRERQRCARSRPHAA